MINVSDFEEIVHDLSMHSGDAPLMVQDLIHKLVGHPAMTMISPMNMVGNIPRRAAAAAAAESATGSGSATHRHAMMSTPAADMADRRQLNANVYPYRPISGSVGDEMLRAFTPTGRHNRRGRGRGDRPTQATVVRPSASAAASTSRPTRPKKGKYRLAHYT